VCAGRERGADQSSSVGFTELVFRPNGGCVGGSVGGDVGDLEEYSFSSMMQICIFFTHLLLMDYSPPQLYIAQ